MKEEPELDSSFTGRFLVELFARKKVVPAEKMIDKMSINEIHSIMAATFAVATAAMENEDVRILCLEQRGD